MDNVTVEAYNTIKSIEKIGTSNTNTKSVLYVYTPQDKQQHRYFHSFSMDKQVEDFMGTAELRCPYDSDLVEYWEVVRAYCIVYGSNKGEQNVSIQFIGRVREVHQEGYELVIVLQDYGWKFKQTISQSYANDNIINKDGYTIMKLMFEALKIDSWVISPTAKYRLKQVGYDKDGNLTLNKKKIEKMPDLIDRLKKSDPTKAVNKWTEFNKLKEQKEGNIKNINYTLKYEKPTPVMKKISSKGSGEYSPGSSVYGTNYGSSTSGAASDAANALSNQLANSKRPPKDLCSNIGNEKVIAAMKLIWSYNRGYANDFSSARKVVLNFAENSPVTYKSKVSPCLGTLQKLCRRSDGINAAQTLKADADHRAAWANAKQYPAKQIVNTIIGAQKTFNRRTSLAAQRFKKNDWIGAGWAIFTGH